MISISPKYFVYLLMACLTVCSVVIVSALSRTNSTLNRVVQLAQRRSTVLDAIGSNLKARDSSITNFTKPITVLEIADSLLSPTNDTALALVKSQPKVQIGNVILGKWFLYQSKTVDGTATKTDVRYEFLKGGKCYIYSPEFKFPLAPYEGKWSVKGNELAILSAGPAVDGVMYTRTYNLVYVNKDKLFSAQNEVSAVGAIATRTYFYFRRGFWEKVF